ncbi:MAG TPA: NAD-binding protein [Pseudonocardia sp.]|nr:NAD-binding protein [Pseudonocardia sp.]
MGNPLLAFWWRMLQDQELPQRMRRWVPLLSSVQASATIFLVMRRMRTPLIVLIVLFAVSVLGLTLIPGQDADGNPHRLSVFDAFYFMSYTASTIGFGELPYPFTQEQRLWVTISIYLTVIGWAYAIGSLLALFQSRTFRQARALQQFTHKVARLHEPFLLVVGFGRTGELLGRWLDASGRQFVVVDGNEDRIDAIDLASYHADVPALVADARNPAHLGVAGLANPQCEAVLALTNDDEANLAVTMTAALLRPELPVIARTISTSIADRMRAFGSPTVVDPFDRFGDYLRIALRAPATYQLMMWLESGPGAPLPPRGSPPAEGRWVICGYGRFGRHLTEDLRAEGLEVTIIEPKAIPETEGVVVGDGSEPAVMKRAGVDTAAGFVAGTDNDTTNLSLIAAARRVNPDLWVAARQNLPTSESLFAVMDVDALLVPTEVVAHEVFAQLSTPLLWRFLQEVPALGNDWAAALLDRMVGRCGQELPVVWKVRCVPEETPALMGWLDSGTARLGDLLRNPDNRDQQLPVVPMMVLRNGEPVMSPDDDFVLCAGDELLLSGEAGARRALGMTLIVDATREYVVTGRHVPAGWAWRKLSSYQDGTGRN